MTMLQLLLEHLVDALGTTGRMAWQICWSLILGFFIAACIEALVRKDTIARLLPDDRPRTLATASLLGAASSSCSYAAVAMARSLVRKGASFTSAMSFQIASTNLVLELGIILAVVLGWSFVAAQLVGGVVMIAVVATAFHLTVGRRVVEAARRHADRGLAGSMEGHAAMDMSADGPGGPLRRLFSPAGWTSVANNFAMEWAAILRDLVIGLLIAGAADAWVPDSVWQALFFSDHPQVAAVVGPLIAPLVAIATFVCSVGNVPFAAVLWNGGISFGGVVSFLFADLLILPVLLIYRRYYGLAMTLRITAIFYVAAVVAGYAVELGFGLVGLVPSGPREAETGGATLVWNYTTFLNIAFLLLAAALVWRFLAKGGRQMLSMMGGAPQDG